MKQKPIKPIPLFKSGVKKPLLIINFILIAFLVSFIQVNAAELNDNSGDIFQQQSVTGTVKDKDGAPMPGVNVLVEGTTIGAITDMNGKYTITVPSPNATLVFSFIGFTDIKVSAGGKSILDVSLDAETSVLDEVVVVGYGTQKKKDLASAITIVDAQQIAKQPVSNVATALQGLVPGIQVTATRNSGSPDIVIRGIGTTTGNNSPLYVIDGIPSGGMNVNPSDIETMQVLKDAASAAIYGARGANGVILITTKSGKSSKSGQPRVSLRSYYGFEQPWKLLDLTNTAEWASVVYASNKATVPPGTPPPLATWIVEQNGGVYNGPETDWQKEIFQTGALNQTGIDISGGTDAGNYFFSAEMYNQEGIIINTPNKRYSVRMNSNWKTKKFSFGENISFTYSNSRSEVVPDGRSAIQQAMNMTPNIPVFDITQQPGGYSNANYTDSNSPYLSGHDAQNVIAYLDRVKSMNYNKRIMASAFGEYQIMPGLTFRSTFGITTSDNEGRNFTLLTGGSRLTNTTLNENHSWNYNWNWDQTLTYAKQIGKHDISLMGTYSSEYSKGHNFSAGGNTIQTDVHDVLSKVESNFSVGGGESEQSRISYLGRATYSYGGKYSFVANIRRDGSSKFRTGNKWGTFPSASAAWNISEESFMDGVKAATKLSRMKLRGSFGLVGNDGPVNPYSYVPALSASNYNTGSAGLVGQTISVLTKNPLLKWESSQQLDLGTELGFFKSALTVEVDYYKKKTFDMFVNIPQPGSSGTSASMTQNVGSILNRGWEFQATYRKATGDFHYSVSANFTTNYNEVLDMMGQVILAGGSEFATAGSTKTEAGYPIGQFWGYKTLGIFQNQTEINAYTYVDGNGITQKIQPNAAPGDIKFYKKPNADGTITGPIGATDQVYIGNPNPDFTYGLNFSADYKGFDLTVFFQGIQGNDLEGVLLAWTEGMHNNFNLGKNALNRWKQEGDITSVPRAVRGDPNKNTNISDRYIYDGSYLRLKNLTLGYTLPKAILDYVKLSNVRVYATGRNLLTFTKYPFYDPEIGSGYVGLSSSGNSSTARGIDNGYYPQARTLIMGIQVDF